MEVYDAVGDEHSMTGVFCSCGIEDENDAYGTFSMVYNTETEGDTEEHDLRKWCELMIILKTTKSISLTHSPLFRKASCVTLPCALSIGA